MDVNQIQVIIAEVKSKIPMLLDYEIIPEPLWADDTGRASRDGHYSGTFIGYFTTINMNIGPTTQAEYTILCNQFQKPFIKLEYPREDTGVLTTEDFYGVSLKAKKNMYSGQYQGFQLQLTAIDRRTDM